MKNIFAIMTLFTVGILSAQNNQSTVNNFGETFRTAVGPAAGKYGASTLFFNPKRKIEGSVYLFDNWNNYAVIHTSDNQKFVLRNINLNLKRNTFESKVGQDSLFTFSFNNIDKFVVNSIVFKNYYWDDDNRVYQVIFEDDNFSILKAFSLKIVEGSANPMINRKTDRYIKKERYYVKKDDKILKFKLTKKRVLKLVEGNENKALEIQKYAKGNKLSFKKENDVQKILEYSGKN